MKQYLLDLLRLVYPELCLVCGGYLVEGEKCICLECIHKLPKTGYHLICDNMAEQLLWGRVKIEYGTALCRFQKGNSVQKVLHQLKYKGEKELGIILGQSFGYEIQGSNISKVDAIIPVPLHPDKLKKRGYNQSEQIAIGLSEVLNIPIINDLLYRKLANSTQTKKNVYERWENSQNIFDIKENRLSLCGKHILLVDDVITTGATIEACTEVLQQINGLRVSFAALAIA
ncbi:MAG: ComF family protein [Bacteroidia bacterium]|nr:ComF family protein [Bacteroidia bacterium]